MTSSEKENIRVLVQITKLEKYSDGDVVGAVKVLLNNREIYKDSIYVKVEDKKRTIFDYIRSWFK